MKVKTGIRSLQTGRDNGGNKTICRFYINIRGYLTHIPRIYFIMAKEWQIHL
jgi:hypothetical protein